MDTARSDLRDLAPLRCPVARGALIDTLAY